MMAAWKEFEMFVKAMDKNVVFMRNIESIQRGAARFVCGDYDRTSSVTSMTRDLGWSSLQSRRMVHDLTLFYKINSGELQVISYQNHFVPVISYQTSSHFVPRQPSLCERVSDKFQCNILFFSLIPNIKVVQCGRIVIRSGFHFGTK